MMAYELTAIKNALKALGPDEDGRFCVTRPIGDGSHAVDLGKGGETVATILPDGWIVFGYPMAISPGLSAALAGVKL